MKAGVMWVDELQGMLKRLRSTHQSQEGSKDEDPEYECMQCRDTGFISKQNDSGVEVVYRCNCYAIKQAQKMMKRSGISAEFQKKTFENFIADGNDQLENAKSKAMKYVDHFQAAEHDRRNSILFSGQVGSGKTHLGTAICGELMHRGVAVVYMAYRNAVTRIKQSITDESAYNREISLYSMARVLYIDDLLKGKLSEADVNIMYEIANYRYMNNMPMIISTEKSPNDLLIFDEAIGSRIIEMCRGNIVHLQGKDLNYRLK